METDFADSFQTFLKEKSYPLAPCICIFTFLDTTKTTSAIFKIKKA